jgi:L-fuconolactonase
VVVQSDQSEAENTFQLAFADMYGFIKGVVGWVDLQAENIDEQLQHYSQFSKLKGFRHVLQAEEDDQFMLRPAFKRGIAALGQHGFSYDILIFPNHLVYAKQLVAAFPDQRFVIDHLAKPYIREGKIDEWQKNIELMAEHENVYCKVSGMVTEANWNTWKNEDFRPYLDTVFQAFGPKRVMFGSDWPVCLVAARYDQVVGIMESYLAGFSADEQAAFWGGNAFRFYQLK